MSGQKFFVYGSGYVPNQNVTIFVGPGGILMSTSDAAGNFAAPDLAQSMTPGTYTVTVYYQSDTRHRYPTTCYFDLVLP